MDEFRKPYEYNEEKRGLILLFIIMLILIDIFQGPLYIVPVYDILKKIPVISSVFMVLSCLYILFILYTAITCYKLKKNMVIVSKLYLIVRVVFMISCIIIFFLYNIKGKTMIGLGSQYNTVAEYSIPGLIAPIVFVLAFSTGWYTYFLKSKRCKELVKN